jgi:long-chain acyl-CoA synthetase
MRKVVKLLNYLLLKKMQSLTEGEVIKYCKDEMTGYKVPKSVEFREELTKIKCW